MEKIVFEKSFIEKLDKNFPELAKYIDFNLFDFAFNLIFRIEKRLIEKQE